jgi:hypothetical protein
MRQLTCLDLSINAGALVAWQARPSASHRFVAAHSIAGLLASLGSTRESFDVVDIFCHGFGGGLTFGAETLFAADGYGYERLPIFTRLVRRGGRLRLLGCETATDSTWKEGLVLLRGLSLLEAVASRLDGGSAWGTTARLSFLDFLPTGLDEDRVRGVLVSVQGTSHPQREVAVAGRVLVSPPHVVKAETGELRPGAPEHKAKAIGKGGVGRSRRPLSDVPAEIEHSIGADVPKHGPHRRLA